MKFTSRDRDNDFSIDNCAKSNGGWWHRSCASMRINGDYKDIFMHACQQRVPLSNICGDEN